MTASSLNMQLTYLSIYTWIPLEKSNYLFLNILQHLRKKVFIFLLKGLT